MALNHELPPPVGEAGEDDGHIALQQSVAAYGVLRPVVIDGTSGDIIDGRELARIAQDMGLEYAVQRITADDPDIARIVINAAGRVIPRGAALAAIARKTLPAIRAACAARKAHRGPEGEPAGEASEVLAKILDGTTRSATTAEWVIALQERAPDLLDKVAACEISAKDAYKDLRERERHERHCALLSSVQNMPSGTYDVILADPGWRYGDDGVERRGAAENHYPTTSLNDLIALGPQIAAIAAADSMLLLWSTVPLAREAYALLDAWGFDYCSEFVWCKTGRIGMGSIVRLDHERLLIGRRGRGLPVADHAVRSVIFARVTRHSEKPAQAYECIERLWPQARKVELFARSSRPGWEQWGAEAPGAGANEVMSP